MRSPARRSGLLSDHAGWALALACWALVACYPSAPSEPAFRVSDDSDLGYYADRTEVYASCAVAGCDPATCLLRHPCTIDSGPVQGIPVGLDGPAAVMGLPVVEGLAVDQPLHVVLPDGSHYGCDPRLACDMARCQSCGAKR